MPIPLRKIPPPVVSSFHEVRGTAFHVPIEG